MNKENFKKFVEEMISSYGVTSYINNLNGEETEEEINEDLWFTCCECGEPILYDDFGDDELLVNHICPICGFNFESGEMEEEEEEEEE